MKKPPALTTHRGDEIERVSLQRQIQEHLHEVEIANAEGRRDDVSDHLEAAFEANGYIVRLDRAVMIAALTRLREAGFHTTPGGRA